MAATTAIIGLIDTRAEAPGILGTLIGTYPAMEVAFAANAAFQSQKAQNPVHVRTKIVTLTAVLPVGTLVEPRHLLTEGERLERSSEPDSKSKLLPEDRWIGAAITSARIAYESWAGLLSGEISIEPEHCPGQAGGRYAGIFANYAKGAFLGAVAVLYRGLFKENKDGSIVKTKAAYRMLKLVSEDQMDELLKLTSPLRHLRNEDQHKENPSQQEVLSVQFKPSRPIIGTHEADSVDPFPIYELLKSLEPTIGWVAFIKGYFTNAESFLPPP